ncbi:VirB3 family type IV secretion system protein [Pantoea agglomerans]|uniref:VirB3 family type IV secretion system protein n=1 Tax=Enterobacter agglomerans TaxID=549 RepID=UPI00320B9FEF
MSDDNSILEFETHNAMSRVAMTVGVPLFVLIFHGLAFVVCFFAGIYCFGWWGLIFPAIPLLSFLAIRIICALDDRALRRFKYSLRRRRLNHRYGRHLLITPRNPDWSKRNARRIIRKNFLPGE